MTDKREGESLLSLFQVSLGMNAPALVADCRRIVARYAYMESQARKRQSKCLTKTESLAEV